MTDISNIIADANREWEIRTGKNREQGNALITNQPSFLTNDVDWLKELATKFDSTQKATIQGYFDDIFKAQVDYSNQIDAINEGLKALGYNAIQGYADFNSDVVSKLGWLSKTRATLSLGSDYKVDYKIVEKAAVEPQESVDTAEDATQSASSASADTSSKAEKTIEIRIENKDGEIVYANEAARQSFTESEVEKAKADDKVASDFGNLLCRSRLESAKIAMVVNDPKAVLQEYHRVTALRKERTEEFAAFKAKAASQANENESATFKLEVESNYVDKLPESSAEESVAGLAQELQGELTSLRAKASIVSEKFANLGEKSVEDLVLLARQLLISDIRTVKESFTTVSEQFYEEKQLEEDLNGVVTAIKEKMTPKAPAQKEESSNEAGQDQDVKEDEDAKDAEAEKQEAVNKPLQEQLDLIDKIKSLKTSYVQFKQDIESVDEYADFIVKNAGEKLFNWIKSLFDSRRAVQKPLVALALSAITAGAGAIIAASSAIAYSVSIALAAYASGRFAAIYRIAQRHNVKMADLHTNATHYTSRTELAVAVIPAVAAIVAPFVAAASVASQIASYCGTIALRAVYSAVASLTVNALEVQYDINNSPKPVDPELFASTATQGVQMDGLSMDTLQKVNDTMKSMKSYKVPEPTAKEGEQTEELAKPVQAMNAIVDKMVEGKVDQEDITNIPILLKDAKADDKIKSVAKLPQLMSQLTAIYNFAKRVESEGNARSTADDIARVERTAYAANRGVAVQ